MFSLSSRKLSGIFVATIRSAADFSRASTNVETTLDTAGWTPRATAASRHVVHRQKFLNVRMRGLVQLRYGAEVDGAALEQHHHLVRDAAHQVQVVRDHHASEPELSL